jgi:hypothetical protein
MRIRNLAIDLMDCSEQNPCHVHAFAPKPTNRKRDMNSQQQKEFLQATAWLRPVTRWAASFSIQTAGFLPAAIRNLPLRLVKRVLVGYQKRAGSGCGTC